MLSRVADALFWISRYTERAEHIARILDVSFHLTLDLSDIVDGDTDLHWQGVLRLYQQSESTTEKFPHLSPRAAWMRWFTFEVNNPHSIVTCITRARSNARGVRGSIPNEVWKELNKLYLQLRDPEFQKKAADSPSDYYGAVEEATHAIHGMCDALMAHDEGWQFIQLGKFMERLVQTIRYLDVQSNLLKELSEPADASLANLYWGAVLRTCAGYHAYRRMHVGRVESSRVLELLLLNPTVPRSALFCLNQALTTLDAMNINNARYTESKCERFLSRAASDLRFVDLATISNDPAALQQFLQQISIRCNEASTALQEIFTA